jgi:ribonuclease J
MDDSTKLVRDIVERTIAKGSFEWASLKQEIRDELNRYLFDKTKRRPMILPIIMEV